MQAFARKAQRPINKSQAFGRRKRLPWPGTARPGGRKTAANAAGAYYYCLAVNGRAAAYSFFRYFCAFLN